MALDREAEERAARTLFFVEKEFEGKKVPSCRVNYLALLNLHTADVPEAIRQVRAIVSAEDHVALEADTIVLFRALNWRFHLVGCTVMIVGFVTPALLEALWSRLRRGSWVSPQLAATAYLVDPAFSQRGAALISDVASNGKTVVSIAQLLRDKLGAQLTPEQETLVASAATNDTDQSGQIALRWTHDIHARVAT
jgi:hypothetical protein